MNVLFLPGFMRNQPFGMNAAGSPKFQIADLVRTMSDDPEKTSVALTSAAA